MGLSEILGTVGSLASIEAEIRGIIEIYTGQQAEDKLKKLCATADFSHMPDELADCMDKVEVYLGHRKSEIIGDQLFSQEEKDLFVSDFFASHIDFQVYRKNIEPIILNYVNCLENLLLQQMSPGEKAIYGLEQRVAKKIEKIEAVSTKLDMAICGKGLCRETSELQIQDIINQTRAELPEDYIERKVIAHHIAVMDRLEQLLMPEDPISLKNAVIEYKRILLLSDAGHGKSTELRYVACAMDEASLVPYFYSLYHYCREPIEDILPACYSGIQSNRLALIFDGFDEMLELERREFLRRLISFLKTYPETRVIISSRSNFCKVEIENQSQTFKDFYIYDLDDLTQSDIEKYVRKRCVDVNNFMLEARRVNIEDLLYNPFYLTNLIQLYQEKGQLPDKGAVMEQLVNRSFALDDEKFQDNLEEHRRHLFAVLEKIAFAMQLMHKQAIDDSNEYQELFTSEDRSLVKHSGLFRKDGSQWTFIHSNFKEYLAAKSLSRLTAEEIVGFLSDGYGIKNSWVNTLSYLANMDLEWDLQSWLLEFSPNALVKFEAEHFTDDTRANIFKTQFKKFEADMLWISDSLFSEEQLASFGCCEDSLDFLLDRINHPVNRISQISAAQLLRYFPRLFGQKEAVTKALLACCVVPTDGHEALCYQALCTLNEQGLVTPKIAAELVDRYHDCDDSHIRWGMYNLLLRSNQHNAQIQFFIDGIAYIGGENRILNETTALVAGLKAMSEPQSVQQAIVYIAQNVTSWLYNADDVYATLCDRAAQLYLEGQREFYQILLDCYYFSARYALHRRENASLHFFETTGTKENAVIDICNRSTSHVDLYALFDQQDNLELIKQAYIDNRLMDHKVFHNIVALFTDDKRYAEYSELIYRVDGISMPKREPRVNYAELRVKSTQEYFNALFDRDQAKQLILTLIQESGLIDPTISELRDADIAYKSESPLWTMRFALQNYFYDNIKVMDTVDLGNWDEFVLLEAERVIEQEKGVKISLEQKAHLIQLICTQYSKGLVERAVNYNQKQSNSILCLDRAILILTVQFDFVPDEPTLLQMLELPGFAFTKDDSEKKYEYLEKHLPLKIILSRIVDNMNARRVHGSVLLDHIEYCTKFHCEDIRDCVIEAANNPESNSFIKTATVKYLYHIFGVQCVRRNILPYADEEMLLILERLCPEIPNKELRVAMECQFKKVPTIELMSHLLKLESELALCEYIRLAEAKMALPEGKDISSEGPTAAISTLHNPRMLPMLEKLLNITLAPDFQDGEFWSLYSSLSGALVECGCEAPDDVLTLLQQYKEDSKGNERSFRFCTYTLSALQRKLCAQQDLPWTLQDTKRILGSTAFSHFA